MFLEDFGNVFRRNAMIPYSVRINNNIRAKIAQPKADALGFLDLILKTSGHDLLSESRPNFTGTSPTSTMRAYADKDLFFKRKTRQNDTGT
jgi:hypothetical protein